MTQRERIAMQRVLFQEAMGKLRAVSELFGTEDSALSCDMGDLEAWQKGIAKFEDWAMGTSPIA